jgi:GT2 family glycosyltransferase
MTKAPTVVAIIVNYHVAHLAVEAADSIAAQDLAIDIRLFDNSVCPHQAEQLGRAPFPLLVSKRNVGFARACNQIYHATLSEYVLLLNPDARLLPGAIETMLGYLDTHPAVAAVGPRPYWDNERQLLLPPNPMPSPATLSILSLPGRLGDALRRRLSLAWRVRALRFWHTDRPLRQRCLSGGHVLLRRSAVDAAGGLFDPRFFLYWEDVDLFRRLRKIGGAAFMLPSAEVVHPIGACSRAATPSTPEPSLRARAQYMAKHHRWSTRFAELLQRLPENGSEPRDGVYGDGIPGRVPTAWHRSWCLELSQEPLFLWPLGLLGRGATIDWPPALPDWVTRGEGFARLGSATAGRADCATVRLGQMGTPVP